MNPATPEAVIQVILKALQKNPTDRYPTAGALVQALAQALADAPTQPSPLVEPAITRPHAAVAVPRIRLFISYKRDITPDEPVARQVFQALSQQYDVFIDQTMLVGTRWAERIETELRQADFLLVFLSAESVGSEMVLAEIKTAHRLAQEQAGRPVILPVRLAYREPFQYPLNVYLDPLNWAFWAGESDTPRLIADLEQAIAGNDLPLDTVAKASLLHVDQPSPLSPPFASAQPLRLESPEGTMDPHSLFYIERPTDQIALETIERQGVTITIKAPRQMGKSSLLMRLRDAATRLGKRVAYLDFQLFDQAALADADTFFRQFCAWFSDELELADRVAEYWQRPVGNSLRCTRYVERYLLKELGQPVVLAMDEVENVFDTPFRSDFFSMLRNWHNNRSQPQTGLIWKQLDLALVTSTEPYQLIENLNQSPFNVGEVIELADFTADQVGDLNRRHQSPLTPAQEQQLMALLNGQPYLTRRALYLVASQRLSPADLLAQATADRGPFGDHLRYHLFRLQERAELMTGMRQVLRHHSCADERIFFRLRGAGLVRRQGREVLPRCQLYANFFRERLDD
ncbi:MAG: AAA-like domain-containing protein [Anaerolineae bacterium]|nr:AAA-like domain-containing protein [Anaerolineae bacterium]